MPITKADRPPRWIIRLTSSLTDTESLSQLLSSLSIGLTCQIRPIIPLAQLVGVARLYRRMSCPGDIQILSSPTHPTLLDFRIFTLGMHSDSTNIFLEYQPEERGRKIEEITKRRGVPGLVGFSWFSTASSRRFSKSCEESATRPKTASCPQPLSSLNQLERSNHSSRGEHRRASSRTRIFLRSFAKAYRWCWNAIYHVMFVVQLILQI